MTEADEVARAMLGAYIAWLGRTDTIRDMEAARAFVRLQMPDYGEVLRDNVAWSLYRITHS